MILDYPSLKPQADGSFSEEQMRLLFWDLRDEPLWRVTAEEEERFYEGNQINQETLALMQRNGLNPAIVNLIQPLINSVSGLEAVTMTDPQADG